jgi:hypothetical protein
LGGPSGQWVIGAADGSIHILDIDGALVDCFHYGASPSGLAIARINGRPALIISSDEGVEAWQVETERQVEAGSKIETDDVSGRPESTE